MKNKKKNLKRRLDKNNNLLKTKKIHYGIILHKYLIIVKSVKTQMNKFNKMMKRSKMMMANLSIMQILTIIKIKIRKMRYNKMNITIKKRIIKTNANVIPVKNI